MSVCLAFVQSRWAFLASFIAATFVMLWAWKTGRHTLRTVIILAGLMRLFLLPLSPELTDDVYRYLWDGKMQHEGINPYRFAPNDPRLAQYWDRMEFEEMNSPAFFTAYLPVTQVGFYLSTFFDDWRWNYYLLKFLFAIAEFLTVLILARFLSPKQLILYAWHPLILVEFAGQAHSEALMLPLLAAMCYAFYQNKATQAIIWGSLAVGTKLYPVFFLPFLLNRIGWKKAGWGFLIALIMFLPYWIPEFVPNFFSSLKLYTQWFEFGAGLYLGMKEAALLWFQADLSKEIGPFLQSIFFFMVFLLFYWDIKNRTTEFEEPSHQQEFQSFLQICYLILTVYLLTATTVHPWYLSGIFLFHAIISKNSSLSWHWIWVGLTLPFTYLFYTEGSYHFWVYLTWAGWLLLLLLSPFISKEKSHEI